MQIKQIKLVLFSPVIQFLFFSLFFTILYSCGGGGHAAPENTVPELPVMAVIEQPVTTYKEYSAALQGTRDIEIRPQVDGYLVGKAVEEGAYVHKGQVLFYIDKRPLTELLNNAEAIAQATRASLQTAQINVDKLKPLVANQVVSDVQLKTAQAAYNLAKANVAQAEAAVKAARINLGFATISAPGDGFVGRIPYKTGSLVSKAMTDPLTVISETKEVYAYFSMSEPDFIVFTNQYAGRTIAEKIKQLPPVDLLMANDSMYAQKGKVQIVEGQFDKTTGAISFRAIFPNAAGLLRSGSTGKVRISQTMLSALIVPQVASFEIQDKVFVYALGDSNKVVSKPISIAGKSPSYYYVSNGELRAGEKIVIAGINNLKDGAVIKPKPVSTDSVFKAKPIEQ